MNTRTQRNALSGAANLGCSFGPRVGIRGFFGGMLALLIATSALGQVTRDQKVRADKTAFEQDGFWIYNDFPQALADAAVGDRPILAVLRCIPCEECVKLDEELMRNDVELQRLLEKFVRVRLVSTNGLDLSLFQFDDDQSFAIFFLNADGTIYGRYGTRSHRTQWEEDVSIEGLKRAMDKALSFHGQYPENREKFVGKQGPRPAFPSPEKFPSLQRFAASLDYGEKLVPSCIHCHQIADARKGYEFHSTGRLSDQELFPFPHPKILGLILDPRECATVARVVRGSAAEEMGFLKGDVLEAWDDQPLLSIADVQWVLHQSDPAGDKFIARVLRDGQSIDIAVTLPAGWREADDISWRASTWELRRIALGGMLLKQVIDDDSATASLTVGHVGQYSPHDLAKQAGFVAGDVIVSFDGRTDFVRETDVLAYVLREKRSGDKLAVQVRRGDQALKFILTRQ